MKKKFELKKVLEYSYPNYVLFYLSEDIKILWRHCQKRSQQYAEEKTQDVKI